VISKKKRNIYLVSYRCNDKKSDMKMEEQNDENGCNALSVRRRIVREEFNYVELRTLMSRRYFCIAMDMKYYIIL